MQHPEQNSAPRDGLRSRADVPRHRWVARRDGHRRPPYRIALIGATVICVAAGSALANADERSVAPDSAVAAVSSAAPSSATAGQPGASTAPASPAASATGVPSAPASPSRAPVAPATRAAASPTAPPAPESKVLDHDFQAQTTYFYCGPAATRIALTALDRRPSQDAVAAQLGTTTFGTNSAHDTTRVLNALGGKSFYRTRTIPNSAATPGQMDRLQADVVRAIAAGYPVVANVVGSAVDVDGGWHSFPGGHYVTIIGYRDNGRTVRVADPAVAGPAGSYWLSTIDMANWIASKGYSA